MTNQECPITGEIDCADRNCELHYMDAPLRLEPAPRRIPWGGIIALIVYVLSIPLANILILRLGIVPVGFGLLAPAGVFAAGVAFTARDFTQNLLGKRAALAAILAGAVISAVVADPALAFASVTAFAISELVDMAIFTLAVHRNFPVAVLFSNLSGLVVDSVIFLSLAFGSLAFLPGQIVGKIWMTGLALAILIPVRARRAAHAS